MQGRTYGYYANSNKLRQTASAQGNNYEYDAIGNLTKDVAGGVTNIEWTPSGKVRKVTKSTGSPIEFRYDAAGNRVEKKQGTAITRYIRDASGNVMAVYQADTLSERPIYGSSILGNLSYASKPGYRTVGHKQYELSNHLGNVLAVVSDRIRMKTDSTWTQVLSRTDYYPFGLEMTGRTESMSYRYGFNGKEKDPSGQWSNQTHYDYGFRIYNPTIGKFLSVDPLSPDYPELTPFQYASNGPIVNIDLDGLEAIAVHGTWSNPQTWNSTFAKNMLKATNWGDVQKEMIYASWSGSNNSGARIEAADKIYDWITSEENDLRDLKHVTLLSHSHGGNIGKLLKNRLENEGWLVDIINIETPQREDFQTSGSGEGVYLNFYSKGDLVQFFGTADNFLTYPNNQGPEGSRIDPNAQMNIELSTYKKLGTKEVKRTILAPFV